MVLSILVGNGAQLCSMVGVTLGKGIHSFLWTLFIEYFPVFALLGFLSPSNRGSLATVMMAFWTLFGWYAFGCY